LNNTGKNLMQVSVIIPVYNAADFVRQAVESALMQPETGEVILVEDGSPDESWKVCQQLAAEYPKVRLYQHPGGANRGAGATRNVGIEKSSCEYIAFLDADDFYLPNRFATARRLFETSDDIEGVYDASAAHIENDVGKERWQASRRPLPRLITISRYIPPEELFTALVGGGVGGFHLDGLVFKRSVIEKSGFLDEHLPLHQDSAFIVKMAAVSRLVPGKVDEPTTMWRIHDHNRISAPRPKRLIYKQKLDYKYTLWKWGCVHLNHQQQQLLLKSLIDEARGRTRFERSFPGFLSGFQKRIQLLFLPFSHPEVILENYFWKVFFPNINFWWSRSHIKRQE
jgi:glycosyltransferase involved in cell wall biosynthesis